MRAPLVFLIPAYCSVACTPAPRPSFTTATAESLAAYYVAQDTGGRGHGADSLVFPCEGDQAVDFIYLTDGVRLLAPDIRADTIRIVALYNTLGEVWGDDPTRWHFREQSTVDTNTFDVVRDSSGRIGIACGSFHANHSTLAHLTDALEHLDDSSRVAWASVSSRLGQRR